MKARYLIPIAILIALQLTAQVPAWQVNSGTPPPWLRYLGNGQDGTIAAVNGGSIAGDLYLSSFTVPAGVEFVAGGPLTIHSTGACVINGTISAAGTAGQAVTVTGVSVPTYGVAAGAGGGSGGGGGGASGSAGFPGGNSSLFPLSSIAANGGTGGAVGTAGSNGQLGFDAAGWTAIPTLSTQMALNPNALYFRLFLGDGWGVQGANIAGGAGGYGAIGAGQSAQGGSGGGHVFLICQSISGSGIIDASGGAGAPAAANSMGGGGGGGGGAIILSSQSPITFTGTLRVSGGAGGTCGAYTGCTAGGSGGAGWVYAIAGWQP